MNIQQFVKSDMAINKDIYLPIGLHCLFCEYSNRPSTPSNGTVTRPDIHYFIACYGILGYPVLAIRSGQGIQLQR